MPGNVLFEGDRLHVTCNGSTELIVPAEISMVDECQMADEVSHGDETFHIVHLAETFWLIGPFVSGAPWAVDDLTSQHPELKRRRVTVERIPWRMRDRGLFGLRLWPVARLGCFPKADLPSLKIREVSDG